jgi:hypothetical protein
MEQRLDATFLRTGFFERAVAMGIGAVGVGTGIFLAAWGISFLWRYTPPEIAVHIANPELHVAQDSPLKVTQDKPFVVEATGPLKIDPPNVTVSVVQPPQPGIGRVSTDSKTAAGDVIKHEVTLFSNVKHGPGTVVTGWTYRDGSGGTPVQQYCYYAAPNLDHSTKRVDIASNGVRLVDIDAGLLPDLEEAIGHNNKKLPANPKTLRPPSLKLTKHAWRCGPTTLSIRFGTSFRLRARSQLSRCSRTGPAYFLKTSLLQTSR